MFEWLDIRNKDSDPQAIQYRTIIENLQITVVKSDTPCRVGFSNLDDKDVFGFISTILGIIGRPRELPRRDEHVAYVSFLPPGWYIETTGNARIPVLLAGWLCDTRPSGTTYPHDPFHPTFIVLVYCENLHLGQAGTICYSGWKWVYKPYANLGRLVKDIVKNHNRMIAKRQETQERFSEQLAKAGGEPRLKPDSGHI